MISIGGLEPNAATAVLSGFQQVNSNVKGIGIFDMVDLAWKDLYNASAEAYTTPYVIADWYRTGQ